MLYQFDYIVFAKIKFMQAAVPKYLKLEMRPPNSTTVPPNSNGAITQELRLTNSMQGQKNIMLKLKIGYKQGANVVSSSVVTVVVS